MHALLLGSSSDEVSILRLVLQRLGIAAQVSRDMEQVSAEWQELSADLMILTFRKDVPVAFVRQLRGRVEVPLIVITEPVTEDSHVNLLDAGADLVVCRPYSARLLVAQIRALMRRTAGVPFFSLPTIIKGDISLDPSGRTVQINQSAPARLTQLEFRLLYTLMMHAEQVFPAETLVEHIWGYTGRGDRDLVRGLIRRLRAKIEPNPKSPQYIITVPRVGYVFKTL